MIKYLLLLLLLLSTNAMANESRDDSINSFMPLGKIIIPVKDMPCTNNTFVRTDAGEPCIDPTKPITVLLPNCPPIPSHPVIRPVDEPGYFALMAIFFIYVFINKKRNGLKYK